MEKVEILKELKNLKSRLETKKNVSNSKDVELYSHYSEVNSLLRDAINNEKQRNGAYNYLNDIEETLRVNDKYCSQALFKKSTPQSYKYEKYQELIRQFIIGIDNGISTYE
jgi:hypothetical protein